ncbi:zinc ribbon domain-containing protein [Streptococcus caprae]|uniref:Zinc ribbon domain-containing protein n=1 Tax=Streptococcus caprae TaxID=1640501 RepID=A0ABV8CT86_9STRE
MQVLQNVAKRFWSQIWLRGLVILSLVLLGVGVILGYTYFSKSAFIDRYLKARQEEKMTFEDLKPYLVWSDTKELITMEEANYATFKPLAADVNLESMKSELLAADKNNDFYLVKVGTRFGIFPDYRLAVKPVSLTIHTNIDKADILLNNKMLAKADSADYNITIDHLPMADYTASIKGVYEGNPYHVERTFDGSQTTIDLSVAFKTFTVTSNLEGGKLLLGDKEIGKINQNKYEFTNYPVSDESDLYVKQTYPDGDLTSNTVAILSVENGSEVPLNVDGLLSQDAAGDLVISAFNQAWSYATYGVEPATTDLETVFQSGNTNEFYKALKDSLRARMLTDNRRASSLGIDNIYLTNFSQIGKESYVLEYTATYDFFYDKATDTSGRTQGDYYQTIGGRAILSKVNGNYRFSKSGHSTVSVLSEDNQVKELLPVPESMVGTWEGTLSDNKSKVKMMVTSDGKVTTTIELSEAETTTSSSSSNSSKKSDKVIKSNKKQTTSSLVTDYTEVSPGLFRLTANDGSALIPGANLGGVGVQYAYGVEISGNTLKIVIWQTATGTDFDYTKPMYGTTLTKTAE